MERDAGDWERKGKEGIRRRNGLRKSVSQDVFVKAKKPLLKECLLIQTKNEQSKESNKRKTKRMNEEFS